MPPRRRAGGRCDGRPISAPTGYCNARRLPYRAGGATFLLSPNRLNVAVSRAQALAIVVGCSELMDVRCHSLEEMRLVNLLCHLVQYAEEPNVVTLSEAKGA